MPLFPTPPERFDEVQRLLREEVRPETPEAKNVALAAFIDDDLAFEYRGRTYRVPPVSWKIGLQLQECTLELERLKHVPETKENLLALERCVVMAITLFRACIRPTGIYRLFWRWMSNPFGNSSQQEVAELLGFFSMCRMRSRVRFLGGEPLRPSLSSSTAPTTSPSSSGTTATSQGG